jgi:hypothetical protein
MGRKRQIKMHLKSGQGTVGRAGVGVETLPQKSTLVNIQKFIKRTETMHL